MFAHRKAPMKFMWTEWLLVVIAHSFLHSFWHFSSTGLVFSLVIVFCLVCLGDMVQCQDLVYLFSTG